MSMIDRAKRDCKSVGFDLIKYELKKNQEV